MTEDDKTPDEKIEENLFGVKQALVFALVIGNTRNVMNISPQEIIEKLTAVQVMRPEFLELMLQEKEKGVYKKYLEKWKKEIKEIG